MMMMMMIVMMMMMMMMMIYYENYDTYSSDATVRPHFYCLCHFQSRHSNSSLEMLDLRRAFFNRDSMEVLPRVREESCGGSRSLIKSPVSDPYSVSPLDGASQLDPPILCFQPTQPKFRSINFDM